MTTRDLLIFTAVITSLVLGVTGMGWFFFVRWYKEEQKLGRRQVDAHLEEVLRERSSNSDES